MTQRDKVKAEDIDVTVRVNTTFTSMMQYFITMFFIIYAIIKAIPSIMESYSEHSPWLSIPLAIGFVLILWNIGVMMGRFAAAYWKTRDHHTELVVTAKDIHSELVTRIGMSTVDDE